MRRKTLGVLFLGLGLGGLVVVGVQWASGIRPDWTMAAPLIFVVAFGLIILLKRDSEGLPK